MAQAWNKNFIELIHNQLFIFLFLKEKPIFFNEFVLEIYEDFILKNINIVLSKEITNYDTFYNILLCCYEIYCCDLFINEEYFSFKFI